MANFTPLKFEKGKIKSQKNLNIFNKKIFLIGNLFLVILIAVVGGLYYYKSQMIATRQKAGELPCNSYDNQKDCNAACSPIKSDGKKYSCKWLSEQQRCVESAKECGMDGATGSCPPGTYESGVFDHCNNCLALCDCKDKNKTNNGTYFCPQFNNLCPTYYPDQCNTNSQTSTPVPTNTPTSTPKITITNTPAPTNTPEPTNTSTPTPTTPPNQPTNTPGPTTTVVPVPCGTKDCDNVTNPCRSGYVCVQARDGSNYCSSPDFVDACKANPSFQSCCTAPGAPTATPTEIIVVKVSSTPPQQIAQTGDVRSSWVFAVPVGIILLGLLL